MRKVKTQTQVKKHQKLKRKIKDRDLQNTVKIMIKMIILINKRKTEKIMRRNVVYVELQKNKVNSFYHMLASAKFSIVKKIFN